jgi:hypothetical protein
MAQGNQSKAERRQARSGGTTKAERRKARAGGGTPAEEQQDKSGKATKQKKARAAAKGKRGIAAPAEDAPLEERIEWRLARIEEAVAAQSKSSDALLQRVNELLEPGSESTDTP